MGKKSKRNTSTSDKNTKKETSRKGKTVKARVTLYDTVGGLFRAKKLDEIRKIESKCRHLDSFSDDPLENIYILHAFGHAMYDPDNDDEDNCLSRAILYLERAKLICNTNQDERFQAVFLQFRRYVEIHLSLCYSSDDHDMEKAISSFRWLVENCERGYVQSEHGKLSMLSSNFSKFKQYGYAIEVSEKLCVLRAEGVETCTVINQISYVFQLMQAYIGYGELLKAKSTIEKFLFLMPNNDMTPHFEGCVEFGLCNYGTAIHHFSNISSEAYNEDPELPLKLGRALLRRSTDNEAESFEIFQTGLDRWVEPSIERDEILLCMGTEYRKLKKWSQSIEYLEKLTRSVSCQNSMIHSQANWSQSTEYLKKLTLSESRQNSTMLSQANKAMTETYLEQYCTDTTLDVDQRTQKLQLATYNAQSVHEAAYDMYLIRAQLFYFNDGDGDKHQAYQQLELYLDACLRDCKLTCYTCNQRIRTGSVPFSCACCKVASYCDRRHQKMTWKKERICHRVLCPLLGYWRKAKKKRRRNGSDEGDHRENERVFDTFFRSICPSVNSNDPYYYDGLVFVD